MGFNSALFVLAVQLLAISITCSGCKTSSSPRSELGYAYTVQPGDSIQAIAEEFAKQGVRVTAEQIVAANPDVKFLDSGSVGILTAPIGLQLFIPAPATGTSKTH